LPSETVIDKKRQCSLIVTFSRKKLRSSGPISNNPCGFTGHQHRSRFPKSKPSIAKKQEPPLVATPLSPEVLWQIRLDLAWHLLSDEEK
jgi:hypothetical protein